MKVRVGKYKKHIGLGVWYTPGPKFRLIVVDLLFVWIQFSFDRKR